MLKIENVSKIYTMGEEQIHALDNVSLHIKKGEFVSIIGPSGSRKIYFDEYAWGFGCARHRKISSK